MCSSPHLPHRSAGRRTSLQKKTYSASALLQCRSGTAPDSLANLCHRDWPEDWTACARPRPDGGNSLDDSGRALMPGALSFAAKARLLRLFAEGTYSSRIAFARVYFGTASRAGAQMAGSQVPGPNWSNELRDLWALFCGAPVTAVQSELRKPAVQHVASAATMFSMDDDTPSPVHSSSVGEAPNASWEERPADLGLANFMEVKSLETGGFAHHVSLVQFMEVPRDRLRRGLETAGHSLDGGPSSMRRCWSSLDSTASSLPNSGTEGAPGLEPLWAMKTVRSWNLLRTARPAGRCGPLCMALTSAGAARPESSRRHG